MRANRKMLATTTTEFLLARSELGDFSARTHAAYTCDLRQMTEFLGRDTRIDRISPDEIQAWVARLRLAGYATASCKRKLAVARCFFNYHVQRGLLSASPLDRLRLRFQADKVLPRTLSQGELSAILDLVEAAASSERPCDGQRYFLALRNRAIVHLLIATGLRVGELTALQFGDIDLSELVIRVRGKGGRERLAFLESQACVESMRAYILGMKALDIAHRAFFLNARHAPLSAQGVSHVLARLGDSANIKRRITPHMFRHTAATLLLGAGVDIRLVQVYLGHKSIVTTQRYTHVSRALLRQSLARADPLAQLLRVA